jgi:hypothetical protein
LKHPEFTAYSQKVTALYEAWRGTHEPMLKELKEGAQPKAIINTPNAALQQIVVVLNRVAVYSQATDS